MGRGRDLVNQVKDEVAADAVPAPSVPSTRARGAVALRLAGASYKEIAEVQEFTNAQVARQVVEAELANSLDDNDVSMLRALESARIERLLQSVWSRALSPQNPDQLAYSRHALSLIDRHAKLHGLDAPQKIEVYTPDQQEKVEWVKMMLDKVSDGEVVVEAEIVDEYDEEDEGDGGGGEQVA